MNVKLPPKASQIIDERFGHDTLIALATIDGNVPNVRMVNAYYEEGAFDERTKFESGRSKYSESGQKVYDG